MEDPIPYLQALRRRHSQADIARALQTTPRTVRRWELRETDPPPYLLDALRQRLLQVVGWQAGAGDGVFIARQRHLQALAAADAHLEAASARLAGATTLLELLAEELRLAQNALSEITGEFSADDLLGVIFARFCIGK